ncbi:MAG: cytochrome c biogenesis CcdA family protein [Chloroflexi bacterium]|nr:cytochrome c biogenesis CcdA family protein [Chloroflexota bacterium]
MEAIQHTVSAWLESLAVWLPVGYAFGAGMVSAANPCGFALLPAYIAYHLGLGDEARSSVSRASHGLFMAIIATLGFVLLFGAVGLVISAGGRVLIDVFPHIGVAVGVALVLLGIFLLVTKRYFGIMALSRIQGPANISGIRGFFLFGLAYGLASLSCTLPIFLVVVVSVFNNGDLLDSVAAFINYALGMGFALMLVTLGVVFFKTAVSRTVRAVIPYVQPVGAAFLVFAGSYLVYYWTLGTGSELLF